MLNLSYPVILSAAKNPEFCVLITIKTGFFSALIMTGVEVFSINK